MHFASFEVASVKDLKLYRGHLSFFWTLTKAGKRWDRQSTFSGRGNNQNGITWSVFCKPQRRKNVITWPEFLKRKLKPTVREAGRKKALVHGRLRWIVNNAVVTFRQWKYKEKQTKSFPKWKIYSHKSLYRPKKQTRRSLNFRREATCSQSDLNELRVKFEASGPRF